MSPALTRRNLPLLLLRAREAVLSRFRPVLTAHGLTDQQWRIARLLDETGPLEPRQIGDAVQILSASLVGVLARMGEAGLVTRRRVASDQRRVLVSLAPRGRRLVRAIAPLVEAQYRALEVEIGAELLGDLHDAADRLLARLDLANGAIQADGTDRARRAGKAAAAQASAGGAGLAARPGAPG